MSPPHPKRFLTLLHVKPILLLFALASAAWPIRASHASDPYRVEVIEKDSGWPVPLVELRTVHDSLFVSDNAGVIAIDLPELMGIETWFHVRSPGYEVGADGFGMRGVRLTPEPGGTGRIEIARTIIAKRLGRLTGAGLFAESQTTGHDLDWKESGIVGCDSVQNAVYHGKHFWAWGDTSLARYPLGIFDMSSATTKLQPIASFEPPLKLAFDYFRDAKGVPRGVAKMPGDGPTWVSGYTNLPTRDGGERLVGTYIKVRNYLEAYVCGLCVWNDDTSSFEQTRVLWTKSDERPKQPPVPDGHPAFATDEAGKRWVYYGNPLPTLRIPATFEAWQDSAQWETIVPQESVPRAGGGKPVKPHTGHIAWNAYRKRWITVFMEAFGQPSAFGELWYAESPAPTGPWGPAVKVLTHQNYTFYNPRLHPEFTPADSPILLFEGTYTAEFADKPEHTPRYNYNQILYRLDLDDPALAPARSDN
jgi:hypothetical protein